MIKLNGVMYYTAKEFAQEVGVTKSYICRLVRKKVLPFVDTGHQYLILSDALLVWERMNHREKRD